ncbi:efflux RND transporter periplasmic adaptor subunit [Alloalcanivorax xenomutans]|uniref:efflux RND transporter periplasmic adaptor subunit n=1 Tax=Alloalcanivorax xenomutans TaxID=1094342 RepID=UPI001F23420B|nr:efflux RND transporter periplasmic adaptor subunit [Alloalcanivorax xenomutans]MCE7521889.1 efflux RND transporter periplasmic adaptor subunit [Alloalcanivorax xenomutans]WOA29676.1 efflux RND transporter periplasmic adaptor subunit [Alloalcanivorax xenomutans]
MTKSTLPRLLSVAAIIAFGAGLFYLGLHQGQQRSRHVETSQTTVPSQEDPSSWSIAQGEAATRRHQEAGLHAGDIDPVTGRSILYYHDPMVPGNKFQEPGKSPFMDMMLVPAYAGAGDADNGTLTISPRVQQNLGMRLATVTEGNVKTEVSAVGAVTWNERRQAVLQARAQGFIENLHVTAALDTVHAGQPLLDIYVPEWVAVQEDYLLLRRNRTEESASLVEAARQRMRQAGMSDAQIRGVARSGQVRPRITITSPLDGVLADLLVREGSTVTPGTSLARVTTLSPIWVIAEVPESQTEGLARGSRVSVETPTYAGERFEGHLDALLPKVNSDTRTRQARVILDNPDGKLVPGMFVRMTLYRESARPVLLVPTEALIHTGTRSLVMVAEEEGRFRPVQVVTGRELGGLTEIKDGLSLDQKVVASGQFLIDSEANLKGVESRVDPAMPDMSKDTQDTKETKKHSTHAQVKALEGDVITLAHAEIPALQWPAMTMDFRLSSELVVESLSPGDSVTAEFVLRKGDMPLIISLTSGTSTEGGQ